MEENQQGKFHSFLFFGIPILLTVIVVVIAINFLDIPVWKSVKNLGNKVPVLNEWIPDSEDAYAGQDEDSDDWQRKYEQSQKNLKEKDQKINELNEKLETNQSELGNLQQYNEDLQKQLEEKQTKKMKEQMKQMANIYANMQPSKAAAILSTMSLEDASIIVSQLTQNQQSSILASMKDTNKAGQITMLLKEISNLEATDLEALKSQLQGIVQNQANPMATLTETISGMPPGQAAIVIESMMSSNSQMVTDLMKNLSSQSRSQILTELAKMNAKLAAQITANLK
ncbi:hypothetical protein LRS37_12505 [Neobacillus sedimentimangrovi]|uniref:Magnesium transporter MgtE intracellular domain-containing protein n=1 Tax=Neobacillus sedimentimangrovi TaxID=2699460 RepID=A0ABS8QMZ5_9BACI|nr:hypothetical protein [Neobacillus sedimentimangrovi]MCD4839669.1 hypothetical protein [Neobacillus sedimentimangrovi]